MILSSSLFFFSCPLRSVPWRAQTFRGHVDSVNAVAWQPATNNVCTGSGDKTVSLWDARSGLCVQTFYGHLNAVSTLALTARGDAIASADADGVAKLWDIRMVAEIGTVRGHEEKARGIVEAPNGLVGVDGLFFFLKEP